MEDLATRRVHHLARLIFVWGAAIVFRLVQLQVVQHDQYKQLALEQQEKVVEIRAPRGPILDRQGQPLALSIPVDSVCINPMRISDPAVAAEILAKTLHLDAAVLLEKIQLAAADQRGFLWVKRKIEPEESQSLRSLNLDWVEFRTESKRYYPGKTLAAHVVGSVDHDENGNAGIEQSLNDVLAGHDGEERIATDVKQRGYASEISDAAQPGHPVKVTIDSRIQFIAERALEQAVLKHHCRTGSLVAMNPKTGEILAMANYPTFDPNEPLKPNADLSPRTNLAVSTPFEPGSCFKVITLTAALETTHLRPETIIPCGNGVINLYGRIIHDHNSYPALSMEDVLAKSSNIGAINIGLKVGNANLYDYITRFGFGRRTGLALPGESGGLLHKLKKWQPGSIGSVAMGHEIMVTSIQLAQACSIIANGGVYIKPRILMDAPHVPPVRITKPETASTMRYMMETVVLRGTGKKARLAGYTTGGKTGTAQIVDLKTHTYTHFYNASFMGFAPVNNPAIVVVATVHGATGSAGYGGEASAPVFREVAAMGLRMMDVPKDVPDDLPEPDSNVKVNENDLSIAGVTPPPDLLTEGDQAAAQAVEQTAAAAIDQSSPEITGPKVPNFGGMSVRAVVEKSASLGIPVEFVGRGLARAQSPPPGNILPAGDRVRVQFAR